MNDTYDVIIVGASVAGCTAAMLYAEKGARVALLERRSDMSAHKVLCTHYIQASAYPVLAELGLTDELEQAGALRNTAHYWTRWGWITPETRADEADRQHGYSMRRASLDPLLRRRAAETPGVDLKLGHVVQGVLRDDHDVTGVTGTSAAGDFTLRAPLTVGADGKESALAKLTDSPSEVTENNRFSYFAYFRGLPNPRGNAARVYYLEPDNAYVMPNEDDVTVVAAVVSKERLGEFRDDLEGAYRRFVLSLPEHPDIDRAERISKIIGTLNYPLVSRTPIGSGHAFIGDAALTSDPLAAVGCAWAMQSAYWLVDATAAAVAGSEALTPALERYRNRHAVETQGHQHLIADFATARPFNEIEEFMFAAAARDGRMADHFHSFGSRLMSVEQFLTPEVVAHAEKVNGHSLPPSVLQELEGAAR